jgi:hypothetical protein
MSFDLDNFKSNPNFKFKEIVIEKTECLGGSFQFDCYKDNGEVYLISPYWDIDRADKPEIQHYLSIINLKTKKVALKLEGHKDRVITARYFQDPYTKKHYIISADRKCRVIVWDLSDNGKQIYNKDDIKYESFIYSIILFFEPNSKIYAVISTLASGESWVIPLDKPEGKKALKDSKELNVYFMTYWWDENKKQHNIISCAKNKIQINQYVHGSTDECYSIQTDDKHPYNLGGMVFKNKGKDYLITSATYGLIKIIDLQERKEIHNLTFEDVFLYSFIRWNDQYILLNDTLQRRILVLDMNDNYKIKSKVLCPEMYFDRFIRKVDHPIYGESILSVGIDWKIKLFVNRNITRTIEDTSTSE